MLPVEYLYRKPFIHTYGYQPLPIRGEHHVENSSEMRCLHGDEGLHRLGVPDVDHGVGVHFPCRNNWQDGVFGDRRDLVSVTLVEVLDSLACVEDHAEPRGEIHQILEAGGVD